MELNKIYNQDCEAFLDTLPDQYVNTIVTSPPYYGLRDYGVDGQIGLESSPEQYVDRMVSVFRKARRVLRDDGTLWLNLGDSYASISGGYSDDSSRGKAAVISPKTQRAVLKGRNRKLVGGLKPKDLIGIPWMVAFALRADGWYLRQDIIWHKPNPMPESVTDRCTKAHEYIFLFSKSQRYYYDAKSIRIPAAESSIERWNQNIDLQIGSERAVGKTNGTMKAVGGPKKDKQRGHSRKHAGFNERLDQMSKHEQLSFGANKRSVWTVTTKPFKEAHFATFPPDLIEPCILAGCPVGGVVLDPFTGSGTTAEVAIRAQRKFIGCELNPEYIKIANKRLAPLLSTGNLFD